jgi:hypothetical protein
VMVRPVASCSKTASLRNISGAARRVMTIPGWRFAYPGYLAILFRNSDFIFITLFLNKPSQGRGIHFFGKESILTIVLCS